MHGMRARVRVCGVADIYLDNGFVVPMILWARSMTKSIATTKEKNPQASLGSTYVYLFDHYPQFAEDDLLQLLSLSMDFTHDLGGAALELVKRQ
nr:hypothetical protein BaRGS_033460 [Batillaria attramentaria]